jgi:hypothetical protein
VHKLSQGSQLIFRQGERRHSARRAASDQIANLDFAALPEGAAVYQAGSAIATCSAIAVTARAELLELLFGRGLIGPRLLLLLR